MKTTRRFKLSLTALLIPVVLLQSCALPTINTKQVDVALPSAYFGTSDSQNIGEIAWRSWFNDPYLSALIDTAVRNNPESAIMLQRIAMAANEVSARKGEYLPKVNAGIVAQREKVGEFTREGAVEQSLLIRDDEHFPDPLDRLQLGLRSTWELDIWHKLRNAEKVAALDYQALAEQQKFFVTELVAEVSRSYYELLALDNLLTNLDATIDIQKSALQTTLELKRFGRSSTLPVSRFKAEIKKNQSERLLIQQAIVETENKLNVLLGRMPQTIERDPSILFTHSLNVPSTGVPSELLTNRPDLRQAEFELKAAELDIEVARANFYPSLSLDAGIGFDAFKTRFLFDTPASLSYSLGVDLFAPLINRNAIEAEYKNASARQIQAAYEYEYAIIRAFSEVTTNLRKLDNLAQSYALKQQQLNALNESVEVASQLFASARGEYLEVLLAQRETLEAKSELIETRQNQMNAMIDLYQALGGGWQS